MKVLTISIAAYNVEKYLKNTMDSLTDRRYIDDIEILIIDDGSTDDTREISEIYQDRYPDSVQYIRKENGGHGSTINKGIELAKGQYFRIIDGDDYVECDSFNDYVQRLKKTDIDMVITDLRVIDSKGNVKVDPGIMENGKNPFSVLEDNKKYDFSEKTSTRIFGLSTLTIKTDLLKKSNISITEKCFYVDAEFVIWCIHLSNYYLYWNLALYMYRKDESSDNSVAKKNMIKNVLMQEKVSYNLCSLYEQFTSYNDSDFKLDIILNRIAISVGATIRTYMLFENKKEGMNNIIRFDKGIKSNYRATYYALNSNKFLRTVRLLNYSLISLIRCLYLIYNSRKET